MACIKVDNFIEMHDKQQTFLTVIDKTSVHSMIIYGAAICVRSFEFTTGDNETIIGHLYLYKYFILYPYIIPSRSIVYACRLYQLAFEIPLEVYTRSRSTHWNRALIQPDPIPHSPNGVPNSTG